MHHRINRIVAFIELLIGTVSILGLLAYYLFSATRRPLNIYLFFIITSSISIIIGLGLFSGRDWARKLIVFFSSYIIFTKILMAADIIQFNAEIVTFPLVGVKNIISALYHMLTMFYYSSRRIEKYFQ